MSNQYQLPDTKPGAYYVSVAKGADYRLLAGPFINDHAAALALVSKATQVAQDLDPRAAWYAFGTCRLDLVPGELPRAGILNKQLGVMQ